MRDVPQLPVGFFEFHRALLQLLDEMSYPFIINVLCHRFFVCSGTVSHYSPEKPIIESSGARAACTCCSRKPLRCASAMPIFFGNFNIRLHGLGVKAMLLF